MSRRKLILYKLKCNSVSNHFTYETDVINPLTLIFTFNECDSLSLKNAHALLYNLGYTCARILYRIVQYSMFKKFQPPTKLFVLDPDTQKGKICYTLYEICGIYNRKEMNFKYTMLTLNRQEILKIYEQGLHNN